METRKHRARAMGCWMMFGALWTGLLGFMDTARAAYAVEGVLTVNDATIQIRHVYARKFHGSLKATGGSRYSWEDDPRLLTHERIALFLTDQPFSEETTKTYSRVLGALRQGRVHGLYLVLSPNLDLLNCKIFGPEGGVSGEPSLVELQAVEGQPLAGRLAGTQKELGGIVWTCDIRFQVSVLPELSGLALADNTAIGSYTREGQTQTFKHAYSVSTDYDFYIALTDAPLPAEALQSEPHKLESLLDEGSVHGILVSVDPNGSGGSIRGSSGWFGFVRHNFTPGLLEGEFYGERPKQNTRIDVSFRTPLGNVANRFMPSAPEPAPSPVPDTVDPRVLSDAILKGFSEGKAGEVYQAASPDLHKVASLADFEGFVTWLKTEFGACRSSEGREVHRGQRIVRYRTRLHCDRGETTGEFRYEPYGVELRLLSIEIPAAEPGGG